VWCDAVQCVAVSPWIELSSRSSRVYMSAASRSVVQCGAVYVAVSSWIESAFKAVGWLRLVGSLSS